MPLSCTVLLYIKWGIHICELVLVLDPMSYNFSSKSCSASQVASGLESLTSLVSSVSVCSLPPQPWSCPQTNASNFNYSHPGPKTFKSLADGHRSLGSSLLVRPDRLVMADFAMVRCLLVLLCSSCCGRHRSHAPVLSKLACRHMRLKLHHIRQRMDFSHNLNQ